MKRLTIFTVDLGAGTGIVALAIGALRSVVTRSSGCIITTDLGVFTVFFITGSSLTNSPYSVGHAAP